MSALLRTAGIAQRVNGGRYGSVLAAERARRRHYRTRAGVQADFLDRIEPHYNRQRRHGYRGGLSPVELEQRTVTSS